MNEQECNKERKKWSDPPRSGTAFFFYAYFTASAMIETTSANAEMINIPKEIIKLKSSLVRR